MDNKCRIRSLYVLNSFFCISFHNAILASVRKLNIHTKNSAVYILIYTYVYTYVHLFAISKKIKNIEKSSSFKAHHTHLMEIMHIAFEFGLRNVPVMFCHSSERTSLVSERSVLMLVLYLSNYT